MGTWKAGDILMAVNYSSHLKPNLVAAHFMVRSFRVDRLNFKPGI